MGAGPAHQRRRVRPRVPTSHRAIRSRRRVRSTDSRMRAHVPARSTTKIGISQKPPSSAPSKQRAGELLRHDPVSVLAMDISGLHWAVGADRIAGGDWGRGLPGQIIVVLTSFRRSMAAPTVLDRRPLPTVRQRQSRRLGPRDGRDRRRNGPCPGRPRCGRSGHTCPGSDR